MKLRHEVIKCEQNSDYEESGKWRLTAKDLEKDTLYCDVFDGVMVCTGQVQKKQMPNFEGQNSFRGTIIHSHEYKEKTVFENKRVVIVGCGISAADIAVDVSDVCSKVITPIKL